MEKLFMKKCLMNLARVFVVVSLTTGIGCGLDDRPGQEKETTPSRAAPSPEPSPSPQPVPPVKDERPTMSVSWYSSEGTFVRRLTSPRPRTSGSA